MFERLKEQFRRYRVYRAARFGYHFVIDPVFRYDHVLHWRHPKNLYQFRSVTAPDRYPPIFEFVREHLTGLSEPRLLSFGCASGEEVFSLRAKFPQARIKGIDINTSNIATCRRRHRATGGDPRLVFEQADSVDNEPADAYDAVFSMAVFVRWKLKEDPTVVTCAPHLQFADFERATRSLARCVRPGGFLIIRHAMFRFTDTEAAKDFLPKLALPAPEQFFPRFDRYNRRLPDAPTEQVAFQKRVVATASAR